MVSKKARQLSKKIVCESGGGLPKVNSDKVFAHVCVNLSAGKISHEPLDRF